MDRITKEARSANMRAIRSIDSKPEITVRKAAHSLGFRFRLHPSVLPGKPDIIFPRLKKIIFVHGCFWHQHPKCRRSTKPKSRKEYWLPKLARNIERDREVRKKLQTMGWKVLTIWECQTTNFSNLEKILKRFLSD